MKLWKNFSRYAGCPAKQKIIRADLVGCFHTSEPMGIKSRLKGKWTEAAKKRDSEFQSWAEYENRGFKKPEYMTCWIIEKYGLPQEVLKKDTLNVHYDKFKSYDARHTYLRQAVKNPNEVLVKVHAASLNPIDIKMCQGYGARLLNFRRSMIMDTMNKLFNLPDHTEFPLVLGRDFSGTVLDVGSGVFDIVPGDEVFGAQEVHRTGALADYICVNLNCISQKPKTLSHIEAATIPYVSLTALSALGKCTFQSRGKRALLLGGSGGIGTFTIQYLKAKGVYVAVTCNPNAVKLCKSLGADKCFDYTSPDHEQSLIDEPRFDFVFDIVGARDPPWADNVLHSGGLYSSLVSPFVSNVDSMGFVVGLSTSVGMYLKSKLSPSKNHVTWPRFRNDRLCLAEVAKMVDEGSIKPVIQQVFNYNDVPKAFDVVATGKSKGKVAIDISGLPEASAKPDVDKVIHL